LRAFYEILSTEDCSAIEKPPIQSVLNYSHTLLY
jgi:hypothetical protein